MDALIGVGGMAAVYMATHRNGSLSALKILHDDVARNGDVRERFLREAYIANKVNHPGTVRVLDDDIDETGAPYIVMELLRGDSIEAKAQRSGGRLTIPETLDILDQVLSVLEVAHQQTIVHRDLKPENLFMVEGGQVKVLDFGIARLREDNSRRTQTGLVMGTPAFMAPEQAMGRWNDVDARTDLWAMGATTFTLLTGLPVHEAETAGEMLVAAATRPARSLARVMSGAPFALVALVDRALAYDRDRRFADAATFRAALLEIKAAVIDEAAPTVVASARPAVPVSAHGQEPAAALFAPSVLGDEDRRRVDTYDPSLASDDEIEQMTRCFAALQHALVATRQYGPDHPEATRRFDDAFREFASALMTCDVALSWNLTPYSFSARDRLIWEPDPPWNRIPYQFFSDGVRMMGMAPGLDELEFRQWLRIMLLDPSTDLAPEDDLVTMLWDANFEHLFFQAVDSFAEGNQDQRARFEADRARVLAGAHHDDRAGLEQAVAEGQGKLPQDKTAGKQDAVEKSRELFRVLTRADVSDAEAAARVANLNVLEESAEERAAADSLHVDDNALALLSARMEVDVAATSERFVVAAAEAFVATARQGRSVAVSSMLRRAVDSLGAAAPFKALDMILELREAVNVPGNELETTSLRDAIMSEVLSAVSFGQILACSQKLQGDAQAEYFKSFSKLLGGLQAEHIDVALAFLPDAPPGPIQELLFGLVSRLARGHEAKIGALFPRLGLDFALAMVRLLAELESPEARDAIGMASKSPHALVRIEALGYVEGAAGVRLRAEMCSLLEDPDPDVRLLTLRAMESYNIAIAGPFLVLRIQERDFCKLSLEERRQALSTLCRLRAKRCEEVCMTLLSDERLLRSSASEETRELAAQFLAEVASSDPAYFLLEGIATSSLLRNSRRVRDAATAALARLKERGEEAERRKLERRSREAPDGRKRNQSSRPPAALSGSGPFASRAPGPSTPLASRAPSAFPSRAPGIGVVVNASKAPPVDGAQVSSSKAPGVVVNASKAPPGSGVHAKLPAAGVVVSRAAGASGLLSKAPPGPGASRAAGSMTSKSPGPIISRAPAKATNPSRAPGPAKATNPSRAPGPASTSVPSAGGSSSKLPAATTPANTNAAANGGSARDSQPPEGRQARGST